jgi:hypothetical protein
MFLPEKPATTHDRIQAERKLANLGPNADPHARGVLLLKLAHIYKHLGTGDDRVPFVASAKAAGEALQCLRQTDDRLSLMRALRASVVGFVTDSHPEARPNLEEALAIAQEMGDMEQIGWSQHALSTHATRQLDSVRSSHHLQLAIEAFKQSGKDELIGDALFQQALHDGSHPAQGEDYYQAGLHYERAKAYRNAALAFCMAGLAGEEQGWDRQRIREVARRQIQNDQRSCDGLVSKGAKRLLRRSRRHNRSLKLKTSPHPATR